MAALFGVLLTLSLARWQLSRAAQKEALQARVVERATLPPLDASVLAQQPSASATDDPLLDRRLTLKGHWLSNYRVYLDNRPQHDKQGFYVLMPLQIDGSEHVVMVQRGWVQRNFLNREQLLPLVTPTGEVQVSGRIAPGPSHMLELQTVAGASTGGSPIRQNLDLAAYRAETRLPLWDHLLLQTSDSEDGLSRDWPVPSYGVATHYGYAFQWFGLAALISFLYVWFQLVPRIRKQQR